MVRVIDQSRDFSSLFLHCQRTRDGKGEFSDLWRTSEFWILESFLEPALDEKQDARRQVNRNCYWNRTIDTLTSTAIVPWRGRGTWIESADLESRKAVHWSRTVGKSSKKRP